MERAILDAMLVAIETAKQNKTPFGAVLLNSENEVVLKAPNTGKNHGPLAHAEMNALHRGIDRFAKLQEYTLVTTCEPCPMCMGAIIWSGIRKVYFGVSIKTASKYLNQIHISSQEIAHHSFYRPEIIGGVLRKETEVLFVNFAKS